MASPDPGKTQGASQPPTRATARSPVHAKPPGAGPHGPGSAATRIPGPEGLRSGTPLKGKPFGRYRLLEELGHGGMGVVWKAWDTDLKREVALKGILAEGRSATQVERFMREARAAARLRHPHIVAVHDVGEIDGQHYFTCDYIRGKPLDEFMQKGVPLKQALLLVKTVAEALQYAHEQGIVHRDVKPGNIIVDEKGRPHLMDFGLAKDVENLQDAGGRKGTLTVSGALVGTPMYMSPEQAGGRGRRAGPAGDQFSLGAVLYELVTRRRPFQGASLRDLLVAISEKDPPPPTAVNRKLHRDVETICLKALEKDPRRRYASMGGFAEDLGRYLDGDPIVARPITGGARLWRKLVKNKVVAIPVAAAALVALGALALIPFQKRATITRVLGEAAAFEAAGDVAKARDRYATVLNLEAGNPAATAGFEKNDGILKRREAAAEKQHEAEKTSLTAVVKEKEAEKTAAVGKASAQDEAIKLIEAGRGALDLAERVHYSPQGTYAELEERVKVGQAKIEDALQKSPNLVVGHTLLGRAWSLRGWDDRAEACWRKAIALDGTFGPPHFELGRLLATRSFLAGLGATNQDRARNRKAALAMADEARAEFDAAAAGNGFDDPLQRAVAGALGALARRDYGGAQRIAQEGMDSLGAQKGVEELYWVLGLALSGPERLKAYDKAVELRTHFPLALLCRGAARDERTGAGEAGEDYNRALEFNPRLADAFCNRGRLRCAEGRLDLALLDFNSALDVRPDSAIALSNRAAVWLDQNDPDRALQDCEAALKIDRELADVWYNRALAHVAKGNEDEALADYTKAVDIDPKHASALLNRGKLRNRRGDRTGALADYSAAIEADPKMPEAWNNRGSCRYEKGEYDDALADYTEAIRLNGRYANAYFNRGTTKQAKGDLDGAIEDFTEALKLNPKDAEAYLNRAVAKMAKKDAEGAIEDCTEGLKLNPDLPEAYLNRGLAHLQKGNKEGARADFAEALKHAPPDWPRRATLESDLEKLGGAPDRP